MCGIFGFDIKHGVVDDGRLAVLVSTLARLNDKRGGHSWGFSGINNEYDKVDNDRVVVERGLGALYTNSFKMLSFNRLIGHSRFATHGAKTVENSHPFEIGNIIGAHNGIIQNHQALNTKYNRKFDVDSMHLFAHLDEERSFDEFEGYGSIEWFEKSDPDTIYLCKMAGGDLSVYVILGKDKDDRLGVIWSSDKKHLDAALQSSDITNTISTDIKEGQIYYVRNNDIYIEDRNWGAKLEIKRANKTHYHTTTYTGGHWQHEWSMNSRHSYAGYNQINELKKTDGNKVLDFKSGEQTGSISSRTEPSSKLFFPNPQNIIFCETCGYIESEHLRDDHVCDGGFIPDKKEIIPPKFM